MLTVAMGVLQSCNARPVRQMPPETAAPHRLRVDLDGGLGDAGATAVEIELRRSRRARRANLRVRPGMRPELVLPVRAPLAEAERMLERHRGWLRRKLVWAQGLEQEALRLGLLNPGLVWLEGRPLPLSRALSAPFDAQAGETDSAIALRLEGWYRKQAGARLGEATDELAAALRSEGLLGRRPGRISIRDPRSRWGSCSARGDISYSWRLVMMPRQVLEYVVCHELCHLEVHNHSPRFWRLLARARPGWQAEAAWLRRYGPLIALHRPGATPSPSPSSGSLPTIAADLAELPGI